MEFQRLIYKIKIEDGYRAIKDSKRKGKKTTEYLEGQLACRQIKLRLLSSKW